MNFPENVDREELFLKWAPIVTDATSHVKTWTSGHELAWLCELASRSNRIVEIGSYYGRSALCMALANPDLQLVCIDNCENEEVEDVFAKNLRDPISEGRVHFRKGTSALLKDYHGMWDAGWIDAGHKFQDVYSDIENVLPHLFVDSILCGHDWSPTNPSEEVNQGVLAHFSPSQIKTFNSIWWV